MVLEARPKEPERSDAMCDLPSAMTRLDPASRSPSISATHFSVTIGSSGFFEPTPEMTRKSSDSRAMIFLLLTGGHAEGAVRYLDMIEPQAMKPGDVIIEAVLIHHDL